MSSEKRLLGILAGLVSGALLIVLFARIKVLISRKRLLKKVDVFAEPLQERLNEFIDIITVTLDKGKDVVSGLFEQKKTGIVDRDRNIKTIPN
jgi:hypothetical protein